MISPAIVELCRAHDVADAVALHVLFIAEGLRRLPEKTIRPMPQFSHSWLLGHKRGQAPIWSRSERDACRYSTFRLRAGSCCTLGSDSVANVPPLAQQHPPHTYLSRAWFDLYVRSLFCRFAVAALARFIQACSCSGPSFADASRYRGLDRPCAAGSLR